MTRHAFIKRAIAALKKRDKAFDLFGADFHEYELNPPLTEADVAAFEQRYAIRLPADYRGFLIFVGNGGAGPHYGLFRLGETEGSDGTSLPWKEGIYDSALRQPWPHRTAWNLREMGEAILALPDEAKYSARKEWSARYGDPALVAGAFPICNLGFGLRDWLVVTGPEAGNVWRDSRMDARGLIPYEREDGHRWTFMDWYLHWLNGALREFNVKFAVPLS